MKSTKVNSIERDYLVIRFSGDSGDGMQLTGMQFSDTSALFGNDVSTFPDYPAEIRAPQGTVGGVSGFQLHIGHGEVHTPGDYADVLIAMNPAALQANLRWVKKSGVIILDSDSFSEKNLRKAGFDGDPLENGSLSEFKVYPIPITTLTIESLKDMSLERRIVLRSKNMFALGISYWLFNRPLEFTEAFFQKKFAKKPEIIAANIKVLNDGYNYAESVGMFSHYYIISPAKIAKGKYRNITGNQATAWGLAAAAEKSGLQIFCGSYPITPATEILQELSLLKNLGVKTFQAEDEIAGICAAIGASYSGCIGVTTTSGPGLALKTEALGLAIITELPLVIVNVQRGGPSTGLPTKTEQSDLLQAIHGRNGESPLIVLAASTPSNCFDYAFKACKLALEHMTPVILLTDGFLANGAEPWKIPRMKDLPKIKVPFAKKEDKEYYPYKREIERLNRRWAIPGMKNKEHRIGSLEKVDVTGEVSYVPKNHEIMVGLRDEKVQRVAKYIPYQKIVGDDKADLLVIGWGSTYGHLITTIKKMQQMGKSIALAHFNYIFPLPENTNEILKNHKNIIVCELNNGQFVEYLRARFQQYDFLQYNKVQGLPFTEEELKHKFQTILEGKK